MRLAAMEAIILHSALRSLLQLLLLRPFPQNSSERIQSKKQESKDSTNGHIQEQHARSREDDRNLGQNTGWKDHSFGD